MNLKQAFAPGKLGQCPSAYGKVEYFGGPQAWSPKVVIGLSDNCGFTRTASIRIYSRMATPTKPKCWKCGKGDHITTECSSSERLCFNCHQPGHQATDCTRPPGYLNRSCRGCGEKGHLSDKCVNKSKWTCGNCEKAGHGYWECTRPRGILTMTCFRCEEKGHIAKDCTNRSKWKCRDCGGLGHLVTECRARRLCFGCNFFNQFQNGGHGNLRQCGGSCSKCGSLINSDSSTSTNIANDVDRAKNLNNQGAAAFKQEDYATAVDFFTKAMLLDASVESFRTNRAIAYIKMKKYVAAMGDFQFLSTIKTYKATAKVLVYKARCLLFLGSHSAALPTLNEALSYEPENPKALELKNRILELEGHISTYKAACSHQHWRVAKTAYESCLKVYAREDGDAPVDINCWGVEILIFEHDWDAAITAADNILRTELTATTVMVLRALALFLAAKLSDALSQITTVLKSDPDDQRAQKLRLRIKAVEKFKDEGDLLFGSGQWSDAIAKWEAALELVAENEEEGCGGLIRAILLLNKGIAMMKLEQFTQALKVIKSSLKLNPDNFQALLARGRVYARLGLHELAIENFGAALKHGSSTMSATDIQELRAELKNAENMAKCDHHNI